MTPYVIPTACCDPCHAIAPRDSDLDVFFLVDSEDHALRTDLMELAWAVADALDLPYAATPHVMSRAHFQRLRDLECRLARDILEEGVPV